MKVEVKVTGMDELRGRLAGFSERRLGAALATALTRTAVALRTAQQAEMRDVFDRPTPYTLGALYLKPATAGSLAAEVGIKDDFTQRSPAKWLRWQIDGGSRTSKAFERLLIRGGAMPHGMLAVPGRFARLDAHGNVSTGQLRQILSQLRIEPTKGATSILPAVGRDDRALARQATRAGLRKMGLAQQVDAKMARYRVGRVDAAYRRAGGQFVAFPTGRGKLRAGIYQVRATAFGRSDPRPVLIFVARAQYEAGRYDFEYVSRLAVDRNLSREVRRALDEQLQRLSVRGAGGRT